MGESWEVELGAFWAGKRKREKAYTYQGVVRGLTGWNLHAQGCGDRKARAFILMTKNIQAWPLLQFSDRDIMAVSTQLAHGRVVFASVYMPYEDSYPPASKVRELIAYCETRKLPLIIGCDSNAHHPFWGSSNVNKRGEQLLEYLMSTTLNVVNLGHKPTFEIRSRREVLDLTLVSNDFTT
jgi:hypothetical protein